MSLISKQYMSVIVNASTNILVEKRKRYKTDLYLLVLYLISCVLTWKMITFCPFA